MGLKKKNKRSNNIQIRCLGLHKITLHITNVKQEVTCGLQIMGAGTNGAFREQCNKGKNNVLLNVTGLLNSAKSHLISNIKNLCRSMKEAKLCLWNLLQRELGNVGKCTNFGQIFQIMLKARPERIHVELLNKPHSFLSNFWSFSFFPNLTKADFFEYFLGAGGCSSDARVHILI